MLYPQRLQQQVCQRVGRGAVPTYSTAAGLGGHAVPTETTLNPSGSSKKSFAFTRCERTLRAQCKRAIQRRNIRICKIVKSVFQGQMTEMQQEMIRQQQQQQQHDPKDTASSGGATMDLGSSSQVVASAVAALDGGPRFGLVLPTVVSGENILSRSNYTGSRLQRALGCNKQISLHQIN